MAVTNLQLWYLEKNIHERSEFRQMIIEAFRISKKTFYNHLRFEPPKTIKETISEKTQIPINDLYKNVTQQFNYG